MGVYVNTGGLTLLSQGTGYGLLIGLSILFCGVILIAVKIQKAYLKEDSGKSEMFMVANRTVGTGLTASAVFSSWMWINETVFACVVGYAYGIAAPMWYATGLAFQIALMAVLGIMAKIRIPFAHTSLEIIRARYGRLGHVVFIVLSLALNIFGCSAMILTGSQLIYGVTGMHIAASTILIPVGVILYTAVGGLKATFLTDYLHTTIALVLIIYFTLAVLTNGHIGGLYGLYEKVLATAADNYVPGNYQGSLLTFKSKPSIMFGLVLRFGNLALVVMDTAFWQKSFATEIGATVPGYDLAALAIFAVPWGLGTVLGLSARVIQTLPIFPTYPNPLTEVEVFSGLVMPYTLKALLGNGALVGFLLLVFMALTSTVSSSMIAVSSILSFDVYKTYINPGAGDRQIVRASHLGVIFHGLFIAGFSLILNYGGANINWLAYFLPILTCPGIMPLILTLFWSRQSKLAAVVSPLIGLATGISVWLGTALSIYGELNMTTTQAQAPCLYGAITSLFSPALYSIIISYFKPEQFDWNVFIKVGPVQDRSSGDSSSNLSDEAAQGVEEKTAVHTNSNVISKEILDLESITPKDGTEAKGVSHAVPFPARADDLSQLEHPFDAETLRALHRWYRVAWGMLIFTVLITFVAWPMPLYRNYIFSKNFFAGWTTVAIAWQFFAFFVVVVYPLWDGRRAIVTSWHGMRASFAQRFR
ncbi:hypothetical protein PV08_09565 [Exophiala spinifera]|uniref:Urea active transporter n=1 Tax=Exophiala spinifera TaxID=91928 RepID=A0A0D2AZY3_9EURO|nr:uncharacterized protein PV08_09565 [Exophiala spinifera]KIW12288.1 hypothetical protein PV08_09565 [Exophiala spinifera]